MIRKFLCSIGYHTFEKPKFTKIMGLGKFKTVCSVCGEDIEIVYKKHKILGIKLLEYYYVR